MFLLIALKRLWCMVIISPLERDPTYDATAIIIVYHTIKVQHFHCPKSRHEHNLNPRRLGGRTQNMGKEKEQQ